MDVQEAPVPKTLADRIIFFTPIHDNVKGLYVHPYVHPHMVINAVWKSQNQLAVWMVDGSILEITGTIHGYSMKANQSILNEEEM